MSWFHTNSKSRSIKSNLYYLQHCWASVSFHDKILVKHQHLHTGPDPGKPRYRNNLHLHEYKTWIVRCYTLTKVQLINLTLQRNLDDLSGATPLPAHHVSLPFDNNLHQKYATYQPSKLQHTQSIYVTRILVRVSDTIRIGYVDTHFPKKHWYGDTARIINNYM